jgi:hypothetical protein
MLTLLTTSWTRYREADRRQIPLFPEWERARWLAPLPSLGAALILAVLVAVGTPWTPTEMIEHAATLTQPAEPDEPAAPPAPTYDLAAIPDHIRAAAKRYRLSEELITAVITVESNFDHAAVSRKGAQGLMQLMPQTAAMMGVQDPHAPDENIDAGASHLRAMLDTFNGDLSLALAAYNAGEQNVVRYKGIPPFPETRRFVARVMRRLENKQGAAAVVARPAPSPQWMARTPRPPSRIQVSSVPAPRWTRGRATTVTVAAPRVPERGASLALQDVEPRPAARAWSATPAPIPVPMHTPTHGPIPVHAVDGPMVEPALVPLRQAP